MLPLFFPEVFSVAAAAPLLFNHYIAWYHLALPSPFVVSPSLELNIGSPLVLIVFNSPRHVPPVVPFATVRVRVRVISLFI